IVATATGKVVADSRTKVIQPLEAAVVHAIHVRDGQTVRAGEVLIELDATTAHADVERLRLEYLSAHLEALRYKALLKAQEEGNEPLLSEFPDELDQYRRAGENLWIKGIYSAFQARLEQLNATISRRKAELRTTHVLLTKIEKTLPLTRQREEDYRGLLEKN